VLADEIQLPPGSAIAWSGQYERCSASRRRLLVVVPRRCPDVTLLYLNTRSNGEDVDHPPAVPFSPSARSGSSICLATT